ncbi:MAG TPA: aromatic ring-hydroxylating dioxygenase subunit alpha [Acidiferrobacterales bacterium]|nr:aromatic ring-hydroxylating dioxygenase subunit alpha [Acidiferrobacterales bacterium]
MTNLISDTSAEFSWPAEGVTRVPYRVYTDPAIYAREQEKIYRGPTWNYLALEAELPEPGDYKTTFVGDAPIVVTRAADGSLNAFVNRCAHRGAAVCVDAYGHSKNKIFTCVYHAWVYDLKGDLKGLPFKTGINGVGGMPPDFKLSEHSLQKLKVDTFSGLIFGSFDPGVAPLADYLGEKMGSYIKRVFNRPIRILGFNRQLMQNNWKLYFENNKDPYHASLLHLFFATFGLNRLSQKGGVDLDETGMHHVSYTYGALGENESAYKDADIRSFQSQYRLADPSLLNGKQEFADGISLTIQSIFPSLVIQQIYNTLAVRQLLPKGPEQCELLWTYFGYGDDDDAMTNIRLKQSNLVGPAGYVSLEDGGVGERVQKGIVRGDQEKCSFIEMGGKDVHSQAFRATETSVRGFWKEYCNLMGFSTGLMK